MQKREMIDMKWSPKAGITKKFQLLPVGPLPYIIHWSNNMNGYEGNGFLDAETNRSKARHCHGLMPDEELLRWQKFMPIDDSAKQLKFADPRETLCPWCLMQEAWQMRFLMLGFDIEDCRVRILDLPVGLYFQLAQLKSYYVSLDVDFWTAQNWENHVFVFSSKSQTKGLRVAHKVDVIFNPKPDYDYHANDFNWPSLDDLRFLTSPDHIFTNDIGCATERYYKFVLREMQRSGLKLTTGGHRKAMEEIYRLISYKKFDDISAAMQMDDDEKFIVRLGEMNFEVDKYHDYDWADEWAWDVDMAMNPGF